MKKKHNIMNTHPNSFRQIVSQKCLEVHFKYHLHDKKITPKLIENVLDKGESKKNSSQK